MGRPVIVTLLPLLVIIGLACTQSEPTAAPIPEPEPTSTAIPVPTATPPPPLVLESMRCLKDGYGWAHMSGAVRNVSKKALRVRPQGSWHTAKETFITEAALHESNTVELGYQGLPPDQVFVFEGMVEAIGICGDMQDRIFNRQGKSYSPRGMPQAGSFASRAGVLWLLLRRTRSS